MGGVVIALVLVAAAFIPVAVRLYQVYGPKRAANSAPRGRAYPALRIVSAFMSLLGWIMLALAGGIVLLATQGTLPNPSDSMGIAFNGLSIIVAATIVFGFVSTGVIFIAVGQLIMLFLDIEQNTRGAEHYSEQTKQAINALLQAVTKPRPAPPGAPQPQPARQPALAQAIARPPSP